MKITVCKIGTYILTYIFFEKKNCQQEKKLSLIEKYRKKTQIKCYIDSRHVQGIIAPLWTNTKHITGLKNSKIVQ